MQRAHYLLSSIGFAALIFSAGAEAENYYVDPAGANGAFTTVQAAVDAVAGETELNRANIFIAPGDYHELLTITKPYVSLVGTGDSADAVTIEFARTVMTSPVFDWGATVLVDGDATAFMARNLTFENSTPDHNVIQALAVESSADRAIFDKVQFLGYQDTLLTDNSSRQYFLNSFVTGDTDFLFGDATAVFDQCTIQSTDFGYITAANTQRSTANGFVFLDCSLVAGSDRDQTGGDDSAPSNGSVYLGRPWQWYLPGIMPSVIYLRTRMGPQIARAGWDPWNKTGVSGVNPDVDRDPLTRVSEFGSMDLNGSPLRDSNGDGTPDGRVRWADPMNAEQAANYTLDHIFGPADFWNAATQADTGDQPYASQGPPWDAKGELALLPSTAGAPAQALNVSTRLQVESGEDVMIAGFIVRGSTSKRVLLRGLGNSLRAAGIANALADPTLELRSANGGLLQSNDNWQDTQASQIAATGIAPTDPHEAAMIAVLPPGSYTAILSSRDGKSGVGLVEIYDLDRSQTTKLANVSTRGLVGSGDEVMIAGVILGGAGPAKVLLRGIGPSLAQAGVTAPLDDPTLALRNADGALVAYDNDWSDSQPSEIAATGLTPSDSREAAIVVTLPPGAYTAVLADNGAQPGIGLVEFYSLE
ncbi:MAG TPA: pectinesterase family protein [Chthoniobacterales bacterium]|nr:pectinesterase family protein [Chthoniobacterales bacterium]